MRIPSLLQKVAFCLSALTACGGVQKPQVDLAAEVTECRKKNQGSYFEIIQQTSSKTEVRTEFCTQPPNPEATCLYIRDQIGIDPSYYLDLDNCQARRP